MAHTLFRALQSDIVGDEIILDTTGKNPEAIRLAESYGMKKVFATMRMYQKGLPDITDHKVFGITSFEL